VILVENDAFIPDDYRGNNRQVSCGSEDDSFKFSFSGIDLISVLGISNKFVPKNVASKH
jgi:hypothetical protein